MKVSIITVCFNSASTIKDTIESVISQTHKEIEYIIVDGLSKDSTKEIVSSYGTAISKFVSEKDEGIYDAMNKGVRMATGDIIGILNSDDMYAYPGAIADIVACFIADKAPVVYGNIVLVDHADTQKLKRVWNAGKFSSAKVRRQFWVPPHPAFFVARTVYESVGFFNPAYPLTADADFMLRTLYVHKNRFTYCNKTIVKMRTGGATGKGAATQKALVKEYYRIAADLKIPIAFYAVPLRLVLKAMQLVKAKFGG
ncbi:MAG: glycosyltransferase family 2 protein [Bacteroidota bacterium]